MIHRIKVFSVIYSATPRTGALGRRLSNRPIRLTQCCTQFKSPGDKIRYVLYLHYNVAFRLK